ncbi:zinc finger protein 27-like isoform X1 [Vespa crabro]|uniref:zinc finger protein 27-like isoform X1 n=1 Tax=Vespa crabro TaxID=7445 RepID=UPI001F0059E1|nr:zinc finger protein 27-like isoform X1 [Vespa crabro]
METGSSVILDTCGDDSVLLQTVKNIVNQNQHNDLEPEEEEFFLVTDVENEHHRNIDVTNDNSVCNLNESLEKISWTGLCRICANVNDHLIPIFEGEGMEHALCNKIHKYLPIHISENDTLPLQLCYHCAATLLAWHELAEGCLSAERRLLEIQTSSQNKQYFQPQSTDESVTLPETTVSHVTEKVFTSQESEVKNEAYESKEAANDSNRWQPEDNSIIQISTIQLEDSKIERLQYLQCVHCEIIFTDIKCLINHMNAQHSAGMHYCSHCKLAYNGSSKAFEEHLTAHYNTTYAVSKHIRSENQIPLMEEFKTESNNGELQKEEEEINIEVVSCNEQLSFTCHLCNKSYKKKSELKKHVILHDDIIQAQNRDEAELIHKAKQIINNRISYKCELCKKVIFTKRGFLRHMRVHSGKRPCKCELCGKCYRIEQDLARHIRDVHEGLKKYPCDICGRAFANKGAKDDHRRIHTGERPYACKHCPKTFRTLNSIYIHNRVHTNYKPHKCSYCGKYFRSRQRLNNHETTHTGVKAFSCEICGKSFPVKGEVMRHHATHNQEKPFNCKGCGMKFGQKRYLRNHIKQHHKEESYALLAELSEKHNK